VASVSSLSRRVEALEAAAVRRVYWSEAERLAHQYGGSAAAHFEELWRWGVEVARRFGPRPDWYEVARWLAQERGVDPDAVYANMMELKAKR